jgi:hypothetical protein
MAASESSQRRVCKVSWKYFFPISEYECRDDIRGFHFHGETHNYIAVAKGHFLHGAKVGTTFPSGRKMGRSSGVVTWASDWHTFMSDVPDNRLYSMFPPGSDYIEYHDFWVLGWSDRMKSLQDMKHAMSDASDSSKWPDF